MGIPYQLVGGGVQVAHDLAAVQVAGHVAELHPDLRALAVQRLARLNNRNNV